MQVYAPACDGRLDLEARWIRSCALLKQSCSFAEHWLLSRRIAGGASAEVYIANAVVNPSACRRGGRGHEIAAVKIVQKSAVTKEDICSEVAILDAIERAGGHPYVVHTVEVFEDNTAIYIVMEYLQGGELLSWIHHQTCSTSEQECARVVSQLFAALEFLHDTLGVAHRDVKPENILFTDLCRTQIKLIDFGTAVFTPRDQARRSLYCTAPCTYRITPYYAAPEIVFRRVVSPFGPDIWASGIIMHMMLCCRAPYTRCANEKEILSQVRSGVRIRNEDWRGVSVEGRDFVKALLSFDPRARPSASDALSSDWLLTQLRKRSYSEKNDSAEGKRDTLGLKECACKTSRERIDVHAA
mmetsp:Transcript_7094/g.15157  ORF Transcript_7094/g.15157 Transcript_7094/m.15157 type:complete len:356 (-) Transcript_7094:187-1254(-)